MPDDASVASDRDRFDAAYEAFRDLSEDLYAIDTRQYARGVTSDDAPGIPLRGGPENLRELVHLPRNWPLARLMIPLRGLCKQVDSLLEGYCYQIVATNSDPDIHHGKVIQTAKYLTLHMAEYLAETIAWLMRSILEHESKILFDTDTEPLLTPGFWILPRELLLKSASRITDRVQHLKEHGGAQDWLSSSVKKPRSTMMERRTPRTREGLHSGLDRAA